MGGKNRKFLHFLEIAHYNQEKNHSTIVYLLLIFHVLFFENKKK